VSLGVQRYVKQVKQIIDLGFARRFVSAVLVVTADDIECNGQGEPDTYQAVSGRYSCALSRSLYLHYFAGELQPVTELEGCLSYKGVSLGKSRAEMLS
jgi:hypothetical protein